MKRAANRSDVLDELRFIKDPGNKYKVSQRDAAGKLYTALASSEFDPGEQMQSVIDILDGHMVVIPTNLKPVKFKVEVR